MMAKMKVIAPKMKAGRYFDAIHTGLTTIRERAIGPEPVSWRARIPWRVVSLGGSLGLVGALFFFLMRDRRRRCPQCSQRMDDTVRVLSSATYSSRGESLHQYLCTGCAYAFTETEYTPMLIESSNDSSYSSSSDSSSFDSSSSSDSSGGGGSDW